MNATLSLTPATDALRRFATQIATAAGFCLVTLVGCGTSDDASRSARSQHQNQSSQISAQALEELVRQSDRPVLVEFGVDFGCARCDDMRPQMARFENQLQGQADVVRVDFNSNRALAMQCGADICPSYVLFRDGRRVRTYRYPVSVDLLVADLAANSKEHRGTGRSEVSYQQ